MAGQTSSLPNAGYLKNCIDWRFVAETRRKFEVLTGLKGNEYYQEACAGGALNNPNPPFTSFPTNSPPNPNGADYVYGLNGQTINLLYMGWQVHVDHCGGLPGFNNDQIVAAFAQLISANYFVTKYPGVQHIYLVLPSPTLIDLNGKWIDGGGLGLIITATFPSLTVDMSAYNRPSASGSITSYSTISVTFPDDSTFTGTLQLPNLIQWSNGTTWRKA